MNITVREASLISGWSPEYIRSGCKRKIFGDSYSNGDGLRQTCIVSPGLFSQFLGLSREELEDEVRKLRKVL